MNERIKELTEQARKYARDYVAECKHYGHYMEQNEYELRFEEKLAELIVKECMKESMDEIVADEDLATETDPLIREYLLGQNQGIVDAVIRFRNHFGVKE